MSEVRELLAMHVRAFNERAWGRASEIYAPDLVVSEPGGTVHGIDAFLGHAQGFATAFPDSRTGSHDRSSIPATRPSWKASTSVRTPVHWPLRKESCRPRPVTGAALV